uniref:Uncharacterized protein n=1 Tax=Anguilla anguilla TaxID=7936 RepID=A0A0E9QK04_ANGAN
MLKAKPIISAPIVWGYLKPSSMRHEFLMSY